MVSEAHNLPRTNGWAVIRERAERDSSHHATQPEAIAQGTEPERRKRAELFIHGENGRIRARNSYDNDPYPPKG